MQFLGHPPSCCTLFDKTRLFQDGDDRIEQAFVTRNHLQTLSQIMQMENFARSRQRRMLPKLSSQRETPKTFQVRKPGQFMLESLQRGICYVGFGTLKGSSQLFPER